MDDNTSSFWSCYLHVAAVGYNILLRLKTLVHTKVFKDRIVVYEEIYVLYRSITVTIFTIFSAIKF